MQENNRTGAPGVEQCRRTLELEHEAQEGLQHQDSNGVGAPGYLKDWSVG